MPIPTDARSLPPPPSPDKPPAPAESLVSITSAHRLDDGQVVNDPDNTLVVAGDLAHVRARLDRGSLTFPAAWNGRAMLVEAAIPAAAWDPAELARLLAFIASDFVPAATLQAAGFTIRQFRCVRGGGLPTRIRARADRRRELRERRRQQRGDA
jgi:hypothetical protein